MSKDTVSEWSGRGRIDDTRIDDSTSEWLPGRGVIGMAFAWIIHLYSVPPASVSPLLMTGLVLGALGDALLHAPGPVGLNLSVWVASVAAAALALHRRAGLALERERVAWLVIGVLFAAGLAWRDSPPLKLLALGCSILTFALAAHRLAASWVRRAGVLRFFELVFAVALVVPILLAADWLLDRRGRRDALVFRGLAGAQIGLVLAVAASALQRLRLYHASYGLTESRFYAMVLLMWIGAMLFWLAATVLRGRRDSFAFGTLASGLAIIGLLFAVNPDSVITRTNLARMASTDASGRFDVAYATSLSADAVPLLLEALPALPRDVQCPLARHVLLRWPPELDRSLRGWNWSAARASAAVREDETRLRSMVGADLRCAAPSRPPD